MPVPAYNVIGSTQLKLKSSQRGLRGEAEQSTAFPKGQEGTQRQVGKGRMKNTTLYILIVYWPIKLYPQA